MSEQWQLRVEHGAAAGQRIALGSKPVRIGRGDQNDLVLADRAASRQHAEVTLTAHGVVVSDLGARNPIRLNSEIVSGSASATGGDVLDIGNTRLVVERKNGAATPAAQPRAARAPQPAPAAAPVPAAAGAQAEAAKDAAGTHPAIRKGFIAVLVLAGLYYGLLAPFLSSATAAGDASAPDTVQSPNAAPSARIAVAELAPVQPTGPAGGTGDLYYALGRYDDAARTWARDARTSESAGFRAARAEARWRREWERHVMAGQADARLGNLDGAQRHLGIALRMARRHGDADRVRDLEDALEGLGGVEQRTP